MFFMKVALAILGALALLPLSGCIGLSGKRYLENKHLFMVGRGDPAPYADGYVDGCSCGRRLAGDQRFKYRQNTVRLEKDALYARGWQEGQINCRNEVIADGMQIHQKPTAGSPEISEATTPEQKAIEAEMRELWNELKK